MKDSFKITILIAVLNGEEYLEETILSIQKQNYQNWELVIIDNGSTDKTLSIAQKFSKKNNKIKIHHIPYPAKIEAYNKGFEISSGDFLTYMGADDTLPEDSLEKRIENLSQDNQFSTCLLKTFSEDDKFNQVIFPKNINLPNYSGGSIMFSKKTASSIFPIPLELPNEDTWSSLFLRAFCENKHIPLPLYDYRIHKKNTYGYGVDFEKKRVGFFKRMYAYELFYERYKEEDNTFIKGYLKNYITGLQYTQACKLSEILTLPNLSVGEKLKFMMYSNRTLFNIRNRFFHFFSGITNT